MVSILKDHTRALTCLRLSVAAGNLDTDIFNYILRATVSGVMAYHCHLVDWSWIACGGRLIIIHEKRRLIGGEILSVTMATSNQHRVYRRM